MISFKIKLTNLFIPRNIKNNNNNNLYRPVGIYTARCTNIYCPLENWRVQCHIKTIRIKIKMRTRRVHTPCSQGQIVSCLSREISDRHDVTTTPCINCRVVMTRRSLRNGHPINSRSIVHAEIRTKIQIGLLFNWMNRWWRVPELRQWQSDVAIFSDCINKLAAMLTFLTFSDLQMV